MMKGPNLSRNLLGRFIDGKKNSLSNPMTMREYGITKREIRNLEYSEKTIADFLRPYRDLGCLSERVPLFWIDVVEYRNNLVSLVMKVTGWERKYARNSVIPSFSLTERASRKIMCVYTWSSRRYSWRNSQGLFS